MKWSHLDFCIEVKTDWARVKKFSLVYVKEVRNGVAGPQFLVGCYSNWGNQHLASWSIQKLEI
jgi:hypothetical protein